MFNKKNTPKVLPQPRLQRPRGYPQSSCQQDFIFDSCYLEPPLSFKSTPSLVGYWKPVLLVHSSAEVPNFRLLKQGKSAMRFPIGVILGSK